MKLVSNADECNGLGVDRQGFVDCNREAANQNGLPAAAAPLHSTLASALNVAMYLRSTRFTPRNPKSEIMYLPR